MGNWARVSGWRHGLGLALLIALAVVAFGPAAWAGPAASPLGQTVPPRPTGRAGPVPQPPGSDDGNASAPGVGPVVTGALTATLQSSAPSLAPAPVGLPPGEATGTAAPRAGGPAEPAAVGTPVAGATAPAWTLTVVPVSGGVSGAVIRRNAPSPITQRAALASLGCMAWPAVGLLLVVAGGLLVSTRRRS